MAVPTQTDSFHGVLHTDYHQTAVMIPASTRAIGGSLLLLGFEFYTFSFVFISLGIYTHFLLCLYTDVYSSNMDMSHLPLLITYNS